MDISKYDNTIDNAMFLTKVDNVFVMLYSSIMRRNLDRVKHKVSETIINKYQERVQELIDNKQIQMFGELNVKSTEITDITEDDDYIIVKVLLVSRYLNYVIDENSLELISGVKDRREEHNNRLTFKKRKDAKELSAARHCPSCGNNMDLSRDGKCVYCGTIFDTYKYDYILTDIETF